MADKHKDKEKFLSARVTKDLFKKVSDAAEREDVPVSTFIRRALVCALKGRRKAA